MIKSSSQKSLLLILFLLTCLLSINCNFGVNIDPIITSLKIIDDDDEFYLGDTVHIKCVAVDLNKDSLEFNWWSNGGELVFENDEAILISESDTLVNVFCTVYDGNGDSTEKCIEVEFSCYEYEKYFPVTSGNIWTFHSTYSWSDLMLYSNYYVGTENWEVLSSDDSTMILKINYDAELHRYHLKDSLQINLSRTITLNRINGFWRYDLTITKNYELNYNIPGFSIIKQGGIPYRIKSNELETRFMTYNNYSSYVFWDFKLAQGPIFAEWDYEIIGGWHEHATIELQSYSINK